MMLLLVGYDTLDDGCRCRIGCPQQGHLMRQVRENHAFYSFGREVDCPLTCQTR